MYYSCGLLGYQPMVESKNDFKVGDKVKVVKYSGFKNGVAIGDVGTIFCIDRGNKFPIAVEFSKIKEAFLEEELIK